ncbi:aromatic-ring-hydroxylating dioxygenase subunit beta [Rhodoplanes sp. Z2-YC6860]|uniref:aromatic-ring-hydroxylating dioxygenase subunit beta n=1 Tax=Rhodoplanes sp. Z2-YC6860 TaxID=674703 RepID=UPI00078B922A|nr:aromatic-ring-hydroxylating dioxygenase subunit beta [Rhodoplanes sp. Z2-YC6860]AMN41258.1 angular dioxygenase small subunit [Rhodoplanes sp. Z2-YC6860]
MGKPSVPLDLFREIEGFLFDEARMLEENRFDDWLSCFAGDVRYWMPVKERVDFPAARAEAADGFALFDDDKKSLELRVLRIQTGDAHAEVPPSSTSRLISNVIVEPAGQPGVYRVRSNFVVYQERRGLHGVQFHGKRDDVCRKEAGEIRISQRRIELAQAILPATISIFF